MIIFLYGQDEYRVKRKVNEIKEQYQKVNAEVFDIGEIDAKQEEFTFFWDLLNQRTMFVRNKLLFLENIFDNENFQKDFIKKVDEINQSKDVVVVLGKGDIKKTNKLFKVLLAKARCQNFEKLTGIKLRNWIRSEVQKQGGLIDNLAVEKLVAFCGSDMWHLKNEIQKLASFNKKITAEDVALFAKPKLASEIFKTIEAVAQGDKERALQLLETHLENGDSPFYLLTMVAYQFRSLLLVKSGGAVKMHPFAKRKAQALAMKFSPEQLRNIFYKIFQTDLAIKTGQILPDQALKQFIVHAT